MTCTHKKHHAAKQCLACFNLSRSRTPPAPVVAASFEESGNAATLTDTVHEKVTSLSDLIRVCSIDTETWEIERWVCNVWHSAAKRNDDTVIVTPLYQVKAWLVRRVAVIAVKDEIAALKADAKKTIAMRPVRTTAIRGAVHLLEVNIPDLHLGKLAWAKETGHQDYDLTLAEALYEKALDTLLARVSGFRVAKVVFPIGSDFFNVDGKTNLTTRGTPQDVDSRYQKSFLVGRRLMARAIDRLRGIAPVQAIIVPGNHDELAAWHLGDSLECFFHKTADVQVDNAPTLRKYVRFANTLLMFTHGDKGKPANWPLLMATERAEDFGATKFREIHCGHFHQTKLQEWNGVRVRTLSALCSPDSWHSGAGYVGNLRSAEAFVYNETEGLITTATFTEQEKP